jgi:chromosome segregation ATPase
LLPGVDVAFRELDSRMNLRLEQRKQLRKRLQAMLTAPRPDYLATADERIAGERLALIERQLGSSDTSTTLALRQRVAHLRGALTWRLETEYDKRLTDAFVHLNELNADVDALERQYEAFVAARQAATHSYAGYEDQIERLRTRVVEALPRVNALMTRQGQLIENVAINQLMARRDRLVDQQTQARYAVADSYDRAARAQSEAEDR